MASTYTERKKALDEIADRTTANKTRLNQAVSSVNTAVTDLGAMVSAYSSIINDINADAANPVNLTDAAIQAMKAEADKLVADFQALRTTAQAMQTALAE